IESFKTKEKPKTVISEILANEDNTHLHLVKEQFAKDFQDDKDEITAEDLEQKTITIKHDPKKHFFNIKDGTIDPASFNKQKYKIYTSVFYFLGDIEESKLKTMQTIFPNTLSENKIKTELQSIPYYNHQSELESEEPANIKEHPELTLKDVKSFLEFRKLQHKHPTDQEFKDYIEEVIASKEALKDIPLNIATNATAIILHQEKQPHQNSGGSLGGR
ncbi:MAG: hypothetical protein ISQ34_05290, partial [Rickettsiales bacterium]|nr:hypothetical protein [Rickettsiales bacterium]